MTSNLINKDFYGREVLIIGGLGFIGSNLAHRLVREGAKVMLVDSMNPLYGGNLRNIYGIEKDVVVNISDVRDRHSLSYLVQGKEFIFNLAGQTSHMDSMSDPFTDLEINATAQLSLLEVCRKHAPDAKIVFASTRQIYGRPKYLPVDENHPINPVDVNGINKTAGEFYHILYNNIYDLKSTVLRLTNTYGPRMRIKDARQTFLGIWFRHILEGNPIEVWGGHQKRDFNYIDDVINALIIAAYNEKCTGKVFNIGSPQILTLKDTADIICESFSAGEYTVKPYPEDRKKIDIGDYYSDFSLFEKTTSWKPSVTFQRGSELTLHFYKNEIDNYI